MRPLAGQDRIDVIEAALQPAVRIWIYGLFVRLANARIPMLSIDKDLLNVGAYETAAVDDSLPPLSIRGVDRWPE